MVGAPRADHPGRGGSVNAGPTMPNEGYTAAWAAYIEHVKPLQEGAAPCHICVRAAGPNEGCSLGRGLYGAYRLARIGKPITAG
jgi:hypothetical protein